MIGCVWGAVAGVGIVAAIAVVVVIVYDNEHRCIACRRRFPTMNERALHEKRTHQL